MAPKAELVIMGMPLQNYNTEQYKIKYIDMNPVHDTCKLRQSTTE